MPKDLKIGLAVGLGLVIVVVLWLATRPSLTPEARMKRLHNADARKETGVQSGAFALGGQNPSAKNSASSRNPSPDSTDDNLKRDALGERKTAVYKVNEQETRYAQMPQGPSKSPMETMISPKRQTEPEPKIQPQTEPIKTEKFYIVRKNDTLSSISQKYYGSAGQWPKIFDANRKTIPDANKLPIGAKLIIPD